MSQAILKGGIVGCGAAATVAHLPAWHALKDIEIVAAYDPNEEAAINAAKRWGIPNIYKELSQMLENEKLDFIDICSPPQTHRQIAIQAMEAGLHVLVEKPMALSVKEAEEMISSARKHNSKLCVVHNHLFNPAFQKVKTLVDSGAIGDLLAVEIHLLCGKEGYPTMQNHWFHDPSLPGGMLNENTPHPAYLALAFLGTISSVQAVARKYNQYPWAREDELKVLLKGEKGLGVFTASFNSPREFLTLNVFGTKAFVHVDHITQIMTCRRPRSNKLHGLLLDRLDSVLPVITAAVSSIAYRLQGRIRNKLGHQILIQKFVESLQNDSEPPVTGDEGKETIQLLDEIWKQLNNSKC